MSETYGAPHLIAAIDAERPPAGAVALWWLGQASFVVKVGQAVIYIDPYLQASGHRLSPPPFPPEAVTHAGLVLCTHDHGDHVDPKALPGIAVASPAARFVVPRPIVGRVANLVGDPGRVVPAAADEPLELTVAGETVEVLPVPARHEEFDRGPEGYPYLGYTLRLGGVTLHHSGDTIPYEGQVERVREHRVDLALLPINGRDFYRTRAGTLGNFDYREAGDFAAQIGASLVVPIHYGMFRGNTVPPGHFVSYLHDFHPEQSAHVFGRFGKLVYVHA
jgi:L-ascorbate 6-phosphate lactonase